MADRRSLISPDAGEHGVWQTSLCGVRGSTSPQFRRIDAPRSFRRAGSSGAAILEKPVSDRGTLEDLSQSRPSRSISDRKLLILKRRDVRVVEGARLEIGFLHA